MDCGGPGNKRALELIADSVRACRRCSLCSTRGKTVPGEGTPHARLVLVGEAPGREEDLQGRPFIGRCGQLLNRELELAGLDCEDLYFTSVIKCRPPGNRNPNSTELEACRPFWQAQLRVLRPDVILALGRVAAGELVKKTSIGGARGKVYDSDFGPVLVTYHPAAALRSRVWSRAFREDLNRVAHLIRSHR